MSSDDGRAPDGAKIVKWLADDRYLDEYGCIWKADVGSDDGRSVAVPLTQEQAREHLAKPVNRALYEEGIVLYSARASDYLPEGGGATPWQKAALRAADREADAQNLAFAVSLVDAVLSASPEVLAAAMGGRFCYALQARRDETVIVLPPREVSHGE